MTHCPSGLRDKEAPKMTQLWIISDWMMPVRNMVDQRRRKLPAHVGGQLCSSRDSGVGGAGAGAWGPREKAQGPGAGATAVPMVSGEVTGDPCTFQAEGSLTLSLHCCCFS